MAFSAIGVRVMIASPSDVSEEREIATDVILEWNAVHGASKDIVLMPMKWETHASAQFGRPAQDDINEHLTDLADIMVGVFWTRVGTPTANHESGSIEEVFRHSSAGRPTMLYFSEAPLPNDADFKQVEAVRELRKRYEKNGTIWPYSSTVEFRTLFSRHLALELERAKFSIDAKAAKPTNEATEVPVSPDGLKLLGGMVNDTSGMLVVMRVQLTTIVRVSLHEYTDGTLRSSARWLEAKDELLYRGLIEDRTGSGTSFLVTNAGFKYHDAHAEEVVN